MELSPEERRKVYEEEKARIEAEQRQKTVSDSSTTGLVPNIAGLLCYLAGWITGIIFLVIEQKNRFVRFHAIQSIIVFGTLSVATALLSQIPLVGVVFGVIIGILMFILWIVLMIKAYQGEFYKVAIAGDLAERSLSLGDTVTEEKHEHVEDKESAETPTPPKPASTGIGKAKTIEYRMNNFFASTRAGRVTASSFVIAWSVILLVFFSFFHKYIAYYEVDRVGGVTTWTRYPFLTNDYYAWLPILVTTLVLSIAGHILLIIYDRYWLRQIVLIILNVLAIVTVVNLVSIFPFNFYVIPNITVADVVSVIVRIVLIVMAVGIGIGTLVTFIKLMTNFVKATAE